ncbi:hypothetical protein, unlikely [Trypanosoma brucei gambiense DAL972]|uniref:Uncharacterized protein n=1 Tax=Trypanosoma brucei gambiense (strain MHOM/CI/86/DAL972) TaxID=679716 RepID=C9ZKF9_TRYB9|nr:hypothetical protein, unlikely [Trypanosoma brucei gambiense DAL972]CBH09925.1 hypothetical protein, unlikely [Trypanosoma brucei gambiense DAL972]|eukprot:XP_011772216.1 hypothetical protein, unlikely [Trypanosoma brucei gambiense DAL972]
MGVVRNSSPQRWVSKALCFQPCTNIIFVSCINTCYFLFLHQYSKSSLFYFCFCLTVHDIVHGTPQRLGAVRHPRGRYQCDIYRGKEEERKEVQRFPYWPLEWLKECSSMLKSVICNRLHSRDW